MPREEKPRGCNKGPMPTSLQGTAHCSSQAVPTGTPGISYTALGNVLRKAEMSYVEKVTYIPLPHKKVSPSSQSSRGDGQSSVA